MALAPWRKELIISNSSPEDQEISIKKQKKKQVEQHCAFHGITLKKCNPSAQHRKYLTMTLYLTLS